MDFRSVSKSWYGPRHSWESLEDLDNGRGLQGNRCCWVCFKSFFLESWVDADYPLPTDSIMSASRSDTGHLRPLVESLIFKVNYRIFARRWVGPGNMASRSLSISTVYFAETIFFVDLTNICTHIGAPGSQNGFVLSIAFLLKRINMDFFADSIILVRRRITRAHISSYLCIIVANWGCSEWHKAQSNVDRSNAIIEQIAFMFKDQTGVVSAIAPLNECVSINTHLYSLSFSRRRPAGFKGQDIIDTTKQVCIHRVYSLLILIFFLLD